MIDVMAAIVLVAGLFVLFGLSARGARRGGACGACPGGCVECEEVTTESSQEVNRVRQ